MISFYYTKLTKSIFKVSVALLLLFFSSQISATVITSFSGGNWNAGATWVGGVSPVAGDTAIIADGHTVTITSNVACAHLQVGQGVSGYLQTDGTAGRTVTISGNIIVNAGATFNLRTAVITVAGTTTIFGSMIDNNVNGSAVFSGLYTIEATGSFSTGNNGAFTYGGGIVNNGTYNKAGTGAVTFSNSQTIDNSGIGTMTINGNVASNGAAIIFTGNQDITFGGTYTIAADAVVTNQNTSTVTLTGRLNGTNAGSTWLNDDNSILLYIGDGNTPMTTGTFDVDQTGNEVIYNRVGGGMNVKGGNYYNLSISGSPTNNRDASLTAATVVLNNLKIESSSAFYYRLRLLTFDFTVNGATSINSGGRIEDNGAAGTNTFEGFITNNGNFSSDVGVFILRNGITNEGTFSTTGGTYTFDTRNQDLSGAANMTFGGNVVIDGAYTLSNKNTGTVIINGTLNGTDPASTWLNDIGSTLQYNNATVPFSTAGVLNAATNANTVVYNRNNNQNVYATTYHHLSVSNAGTKTLLGNTVVNGTYTSSGTAAITCGVNNLSLNGLVSHTSTGNFTAGVNIVTYAYAGAQDMINGTYGGQLVLSGSGTKTLLNNASVTGDITINNGVIFDLNAKTLTTSGNITVDAGAELDVLSSATVSAQLLLANTKILTNNGTFKLLGQTGFPAIVSRNAAGTYSIVQNIAGAVFHANIYQIDYTNGGVVISDGTIDATNNFSNGSFSNGSGAQYLNLNSVNLTGLPVLSGVVFNAGPTYNISRTSGTGAINLQEATGAKAGEAYDNDNGNPGTLINWTYPGSTFYSKAGSSFQAGDLSMWTSNADGSGSNPTSVNDGLKTLIIQNGHIVVLESVSGNIDVNQLIVQNGGVFTIGNDATQRTLTIQSNFEVQSGGIVQVGSSGSHIVNLYGDIRNDGTFSFRSSAVNVANVNFYGTSSSVYGTNPITFNDVNFKTASSTTTSIAFTIRGNVNLEASSTFNDGGLTHSVSGNWTEALGGQLSGSGTINFNGIINTINTGSVPIVFNNVIFSGGGSGSVLDAIQVNGNFTVSNNTAVTFGNYAITLNGDISVNSGASLSQAANTCTLNGATLQTLDLDGTSTFYNLTLQNTGTKTISGSLSVTNIANIVSGATLSGNAILTISRFRIDGTFGMAGSVTLTGNGDAVTPIIYSNTGAIDFGTAELIVTGNCWVGFVAPATSCDITMHNNVSVTGGYIVLVSNTNLTGQLANTLSLSAGRSLYVRDVDNFPDGFGTYSFNPTSWVRYDAALSQTVRSGMTYGNIELNGATTTKEADGSLDIDGNIDLNGAVIFDLANFTHYFSGASLLNATNSSIIGTSTFVLDGNIAQTIETSGTGSYSFNTIDFRLNETASFTKVINAGSTLNLTGDFIASNTQGSTSVIHTININTITLGGSPQNINIGDFCLLNTSHTNFSTSFVDLFVGTKTFTDSSTVYYGLNGLQNIADGFTYGSIGFNNNNKIAEGNLDINGRVYSSNNTGVFYDGGFTHTVAGKWSLNQYQYTAASATGTIILDGVDQDVTSNDGPNYFRNFTINNSGIAKLNSATTTVFGNLTIQNGGKLESFNTLNVAGNWTENGTGEYISTDLVTTGVRSTVFNGTSNQTITQSAASSFFNVSVNNTGALAADTVKALTALTLEGSLTITADNGVFSISDNNLYLADNLIVNADAGNALNFIVNNNTVYFNGSGASSQNVLNRNANPLTFNNVEFSGSRTKIFACNAGSNVVRVNGDFYINTAGVDGTGWGGNAAIDFVVYGDWTKTGSFTHTNRTVTFSGANQNISATSNFHHVIFAGSDTKTILGDLKVDGNLTIQSSLDANDFYINLSGAWTNTIGTFIPGTGTVNFENNDANITTGTTTGPAVGKSFYNVVINKNIPPTSATIQTSTLLGDLDVTNDLTISSGRLTTGIYDIFVGGSFTNSSTFNANQDAHTLTLQATSGIKDFNPGGAAFRGITVNAPGATYKVGSDFSYTNVNFTLTDGYFDLNGKNLTVNSNNRRLVINGGTFDLDSGRITFTGTTQILQNSGGTLRIVGTSSSPATITKSANNYTITQSAGTLHANNYKIDQSNGFTISGGTIDAINNFSNGTFSAGAAATSYLTLTGFDFPDDTVSDVVFSSGPAFNVTRTSGTGTITFANASGNFAGESFDQDNGNPGTLINWTYPNGYFWDGEAGTDDWNDALNWTSNAVPTDTDYVYLNHSIVAGAYTVKIKNTNAVCARLNIDSEGAGAIGLTLENGYDLLVKGNINISALSTLTATDNTNLITVWGFWTNSGTFSHGNSTVLFAGPAGVYTINTGGNGVGKKFYDFTINAPGASYILASAADFDNNVTVTNGTFDLGGTANDIIVGGNWNIDLIGGGFFYHRNADVTFDGGNQSINNGPFYNLIANGTNSKTITSNLEMSNSLSIGNGVTLDALTNNLFVGLNWTNNGTFSQSGLGSVNFNGTAAQIIDNGTNPTTFNHLILSNAGTKTLNNNINLNGDFTINTGTGTVNLQAFTVTGIGTNIFNNVGTTTMQVRGANNFPDNFASYSLGTGTVQYISDIDQTIRTNAVRYYHLNLADANAPATSIKTCAAGTLYVDGDFTINDGRTQLDMNANSANMELLGTVDNCLSVAAGGSINWGTGTSSLTVNRVGNWDIDVDITTFNNIIFAGTGNKWVQSNLIITGDMTVKNGVSVRMYPDNTPANYRTITGSAGKTLTLEGGSVLYCATPATTSAAIPLGFSTYDFSPTLTTTSTIYLNSPAGSNQTVYTGVTYGNLYLRNAKIAASDGLANLNVDGSFDEENATFEDNTRNIFIAGPNIWLNNYSPSSSAIVLTLDGTDQYLRDNLGPNLIIPSLSTTGTGTKNIGDAQGGGNADNITIQGNFTNAAGVTVTSTNNRPFTCIGSSWSNNGIFMQTGSSITFSNVGAVSINAGPSNANNYFNNISFSGGGTKTFITNSADVNGTFTINAGTVDLGSLSHTIGGTITNTAGGTLTSVNANITLDGAAQNVNSLPSFAVNNITLAGTNIKRLFSNWTVNGDLTINSGVTLNTYNNTSASYDINIKGNWINNGTYTHNNRKVTFDGATSPISITAGVSAFYDVDFIPTAPVNYTLQTATTRISRAMLLETNATLNLNSTILILGNNNAGKTYTINGTLNVNENSSLKFDCQNSQPVMNVNGILRLVGTDATNIATISRQAAGTAATNALINILSGGTIHARYYLVEYLQDAGFICQAGSNLDATNNFSDGIWSNIRTVAGVCYLNLESNYAGGVINNITFNYTGTPTPGTHFNVRRNVATPDITFDNVSGNLGLYQHEDDEEASASATTGKLRWPAVTLTNWTGAVSIDWHNPANWDNGVPTSTINAVIPDRANDPTIISGDAECRNLTITNGSLILDNDNNLTASGDISIGSTGAGNLAVATSNSTIYCGGLWTRGATGVFTHGSGTVVFNSSAGSATITPLASSFYNVTFDNANTVFYLSGATINILGDFSILNGTVSPSTNNYIYNVSEDINFQGTFTPTTGAVTAGTVVLNGAVDQQITKGRFYNLTVSGSGNKNTNDTIIIYNATIVNSTLRANAGSIIDFNGDVTINVSGSFEDGGETHPFSGLNWYGYGNYVGNGTILFDKSNGNQSVWDSKFHSIDANCPARRFLLRGNITMTGDFTLRSGTDYAYLYDKQITNTSGTGNFILEAGTRAYLTGTNNFPSGFLNYTIAPTNSVYYTASADQSVAGIAYGNLYLLNNTKTLLGDIDVQGSLFLNNAVTLDVSTNNYNITLAGNWTGQGGSTTTFIPRQGQVTFNGNIAQDISYDVTSSNEFYDFAINSTGSVRFWNPNVTQIINNNLTISSGTLNVNTRSLNIGGDLNNIGGSLTNISTIFLNKNSGNAIIRSNGTIINNLNINSPGNAIYTLQDNLTVNNNFIITAGTFDGNGMTVNSGFNTSAELQVEGTYKIGAGGILALGDGVGMTIGTTGTFEIVGNSGSVAMLTRNSTGGFYDFLCHGNIKARYYIFEYMSANNGINLSSTATIDAVSNFSDGTFTNGQANATLLKVENTQTFTDPNYIQNVSFPLAPGGSSYNVGKSPSGILEFYNATGTFSGESNDVNDASNLVIWTGPITLTWNGSQSTDWNNAMNWTASSGPNIVPTGVENVIIPYAVNSPILNSIEAYAANLTIITTGTSSSLTLNGNSHLIVGGDFNLVGSSNFNLGATDTITVAGNWTKGTANTSLNGNVEFNGIGGGSKTINNGASPFNKLTISGTNLYQLGTSTTVNGDFTIDAGASFDVAAAVNFTVKGNWSNAGIFNARTGTSKVILAATSGTKTITTGGSAFNHLDVSSTGTATYQLNGTASINGTLNVLSGATFDMNANILNMGDATGPDYLNIYGIMEVDANATLRMGSNSNIVVANSPAGTLKLLGSGTSSRATITRQSAGYYSITLNAAASLWARYYNIEYTNTIGINMISGSILNSSNNLSDGIFSYGQAGGRYLTLATEFGGDISINNVVFNAGPNYNITRTSGTNTITLNDASGALGNYLFEEDMGGTPDANLGLLLWGFINTYTWTGAVNTDWHTGGNWSSGLVPDNTKDAIIPNVINKPIISSAAAEAARITINTGSSLTINNQNLTIVNDLYYAGTITAIGSPIISVGDNWTSASGTFTPGNSRVVFTALSGTKNIQQATSQFYDLEINTAGIYRFTVATTIQHNLTITTGTLNPQNFGVYVGGSWSNSGTFNQGTGTVYFNGALGTHSINSGGQTFYNLNITGAATYQQASHVTVSYNYTQSAGTLNTSNNGGTTSYNLTIGNRLSLSAGTIIANASQIQIGENYSVTGSGIFTCGTSTIVMSATSGTKTITPRTSPIYNLTINGAATFRVGGATYILGNLTINTGILDVTTSNRNIYLSGNWTNNGTFVPQLGNVEFRGVNQSITNAAGQTFYRLSLNSTGTLTFANGNVTATNILTLTAGRINTGVYKLTLGTSTANIGTLSFSTGFIIGKFERWLNATGTDYPFPIGTATNDNRLVVRFNAGLTAGTLLTEFIATDPGSAGLPLSDGGLNISDQFTEGYWNVIAQNSLACTDYNLTLASNGFTSFAVDADVRILKRTNSGNWTLDGTHVAAVNPNIFRNSMNGISSISTQFCLGKSNCAIPAITLDPTAQIICAGNNTSFSITATGTSLTYQWQLSINGGADWNNQGNGGVYSNMTTDAMSITGAIVGMDAYLYRCVITDACAQTLNSASALLTVNPLLPVSVSIAADNNNVCVGTTITYTANPTNGGAAPSYQWQVNGGNVGTDSDTYSFTPADGDDVSCILTSNATCATGTPATSNTIIMAIHTIPISQPVKHKQNNY